MYDGKKLKIILYRNKVRVIVNICWGTIHRLPTNNNCSSGLICAFLQNIINRTYNFETYLVTPGVDPTLQALDLFKLLIIELLPTLGSPTTPTRIEVLISLFLQ